MSTTRPGRRIGKWILAAVAILVFTAALLINGYVRYGFGAEKLGTPTRGSINEVPKSVITGGPIVAAVVEGLEAIRVVREMLGATSGLKAAPGTIRGDYSSSRQMNLVHGSDGPEAAARETALYFRDEEICAYQPTISTWLRASDES